MHFVIAPGIDNSDEQHWQSIWEAEWGSAATRIAVASWNSPELDDWVGAIERAVRMAQTPDVVLVAHSGDVGLLRAGWPTGGLTHWDCSWWRHLTSTATSSAPLYRVSRLSCLSRLSYLAWWSPVTMTRGVRRRSPNSWPPTGASHGSVWGSLATSTPRVESAGGISVVHFSPPSPPDSRLQPHDHRSDTDQHIADQKLD